MKKMPQHFDKAGARDILSRELWMADLLLGGMFKAELMVCRFERKLVEGETEFGREFCSIFDWIEELTES
jgi:hypothetical protein